MPPRSRPKPAAAQPPPFFLYARIRKIYFPGAPTTRLTLLEILKPENIGAFSPLIRLKEPDTLACSTVLSLRIEVPSRESQLSLLIHEYYPTFGDVEIARVILPLSWFPPNALVSYPFPLITHRAEGAPMVLIDVHLSEGKAAPFSAPPGRLRVAPSWPIPACMPGGRPDGDARTGDGGTRAIPLPDIPPHVIERGKQKKKPQGAKLTVTELFPVEAIGAWFAAESAQDQ
jgi:hypothetical protein